jgi:hypothetical protein
MRFPVTFVDREEGERSHATRPMEGTVVYIHPHGFYHTVAFQLRGGVVKESFSGTGV